MSGEEYPLLVRRDNKENVETTLDGLQIDDWARFERGNLLARYLGREEGTDVMLFQPSLSGGTNRNVRNLRYRRSDLGTTVGGKIVDQSYTREGRETAPAYVKHSS